MSGDPFSLFTGALERFVKVRYFGADKGRSACVVCGGKNQSAFAFERKPDGGVRFRCYKNECDIHAITSKLGLDPSDLFPPRLDGHFTPRPRRIGMLSPSQCLEVIEFECSLVWTAAHNLANGHGLKPEDLTRLSMAAARIGGLIREVRA